MPATWDAPATRWPITGSPSAGRSASNSIQTSQAPTNGAPSPGSPRNVEIAVLVPCYNEEAAIATVVKDFRAALPSATIYVYDNNSRDQTVTRARDAGAVVRTEQRQGKGNVVRRMFADIEADIYVLVDGDDTYDAGASPRMISQMISDGADLLTARRVHTDA